MWTAVGDVYNTADDTTYHIVTVDGVVNFYFTSKTRDCSTIYATDDIDGCGDVRVSTMTSVAIKVFAVVHAFILTTLMHRELTATLVPLSQSGNSGFLASFRD